MRACENCKQLIISVIYYFDNSSQSLDFIVSLRPNYKNKIIWRKKILLKRLAGMWPTQKK